MDFVKREQQNVVDDESYKAYTDAVQKVHMEMPADFQHTPITMEQLHQAMQSTLNASSLVHNFQIPLSPRHMSTLMLKTNNFSRNVNFGELTTHLSRNIGMDLDGTQNITNGMDMSQNLGRGNVHEEVVLNQNMIRSIHNELGGRELSLQQNVIGLAQNMHQQDIQENLNQDLRSSLQMIQNLGRNIADVLPQNLARSEPELSQNMNRNMDHEMNLSHHLSRSNIEMNLLPQDDPRRGSMVPPCLPADETIDHRLAHRESRVDESGMMMPMSFQIKSEQEDDAHFYDHNYISEMPGHITIDHSETGQSNVHPDNQMYAYYNNLANINTPALGHIDLYARQQNFIQNYSVNNVSRDNDAQNLIVHRQYDGIDNYVPDEVKRLKESMEEDTKATVDHAKIVEPPKEDLKPVEDQKAFYAQYNDSVDQVYSEKNENDSSYPNKIPVNSADDIAYKSLIEAESANIKGEYLCYKCHEVFPSKRDLRQHSKNCTEDPENAQNCADERSGKFGCTQCPYKCQSPAILKIHERTHTGEKPFSCKFCDYKSGQKNNVAKHILVHMKEKPFRCQYCDYRCAQKNNLVVHERTHTGYKPFACTYCDYRTVQKPNLVKHMYLHTDQKPFSCDLCSYRCVQKTNLTKHKQRHMNERNGESMDAVAKSPTKPYRPRQKTVKCGLCSYKCVQKSSLDKHIQFKHPDVRLEDARVEGYDEEQELGKDAGCEVQGLNLMKGESGEVQNLSVRRDLNVEEKLMEPLQIQS